MFKRHHVEHRSQHQAYQPVRHLSPRGRREHENRNSSQDRDSSHPPSRKQRSPYRGRLFSPHYRSTIQTRYNKHDHHQNQRYQNRNHHDDNYQNHNDNYQNQNQNHQNQNYQNQNYHNQNYQNQNYQNQNYQNQNYHNQNYHNQNYQNQNYQNHHSQNYHNQNYHNHNEPARTRKNNFYPPLPHHETEHVGQKRASAPKSATPSPITSRGRSPELPTNEDKTTYDEEVRSPPQQATVADENDDYEP
jgi:hypothetical protein